MKMFKLDKYNDDKLDESYTIPVAFIRLLTSILPSIAMKELNQVGFNFDALIEASKQNEKYHETFVVEEKSVQKRIEVYLV